MFFFLWLVGKVDTQETSICVACEILNNEKPCELNIWNVKTLRVCVMWIVIADVVEDFYVHKFRRRGRGTERNTSSFANTEFHLISLVVEIVGFYIEDIVRICRFFACLLFFFPAKKKW